MLNRTGIISYHSNFLITVRVENFKIPDHATASSIGICMLDSFAVFTTSRRKNPSAEWNRLKALNNSPFINIMLKCLWICRLYLQTLACLKRLVICFWEGRYLFEKLFKSWCLLVAHNPSCFSGDHCCLLKIRMNNVYMHFSPSYTYVSTFSGARCIWLL